MPLQSTLADSIFDITGSSSWFPSSIAEKLKVESVLEYLGNLLSSPREATKALVTSGVILVLLVRWLRVRRVSRRGGGGRYVRDLSKVGSESESTELWNSYDVIIIGGGTSGCALAARLSEDPNIRVLMLEAGGSGTAVLESRTPSMFGKLFISKHVYPFQTEPQVYAKGKKHFWPRGKLLGGCSSINAQMAQYGAPGDFDDWARIIGDDSWSWKSLRRYFKKMECYTPHPEYPLVDSSFHGKEGPICVGYNNYHSSESRAFIKSCINVGISWTPDFNGPKGTLGVSRVMTYVDEKHQRVSSESAYLTPDVLSRKNLTVAIHATVTRIVFEKVKGETRAVGVEFAASKWERGTEPKLSGKWFYGGAGAIHSPHILMLSGVGPAQHLRSHRIPVVLDRPGVGQHLTDHPIMDVYFKDKSEESMTWLMLRSIGDFRKYIIPALQYFVMGSGGPLAVNFGGSAAFIRTDDPKLFPVSKFPDQLQESASAKDSPDLELFTSPFAFKEHGAITFDVPTNALRCYLLRPISTGEVLLKSNDPWEMPSPNPNYFQSRDDLLRLVRGVRILLDIAHSEPLNALLDHSCTRADLDHYLHLKSDEEITEVVKERVETVYHPTSTCRMAPEVEGGVVDGKLRVYGIKGLRVCDASIFPSIISGHTSGACYVLGEKLADEMKAEYKSA